VSDLRYALRSLSRQPGFCVSAILTLALGIGANTAMFSVFDAVILHPLPYSDPSRLVLVWQTLPNRVENPVSGVSYIEWSKQARSFDPLLAMRNLYFTFRTGNDSHQLLGAQVSRGFFSALGLPPILGREFRPGEEQSDHNRVAVVSYSFWQRAFGADPHALGTSLNLNGDPYTLIGVTPQNFDESLALRGVEVWTPLSFDQAGSLRSNNMAVIGRLKLSVTIEAANREMQVISARLESEFRDLYQGWSASVTPLEDYGTGKLRATVAALLIAVGMVLLIACVNVANLLLARSGARHKEAAIRAALGASRVRLLRQLLTETLLLALAGSLAGVALAYTGLRLLIAIQAVELPGLSHAGLNGRVLAFTVAVTAFTGLLFGLLPSRQVLGGDLNQAVRESGRSSINTRRSRSSRNILVISEIALSLILLVGAGLMARSLLWLQNENRGFVSDHLLTFRVSFLASDFPIASSMAAYYRSLLDRIAALPGVRSVAANTNLPLDGFVLTGQRFRLSGVGLAPSPSDSPTAACNLINSGYLRALGIPLAQGREFDTRDRNDSPPVAIVSHSFARRYFSGENPIGRKLIVATPGKAAIEITREIVGVAGDVHYLTRQGDESLEIYLPYVQTTWPNIYVMLRSTGDPGSLARQLRAALRDTSWNRQSIAELTTMQQRISALNDKPRLNSLLAALFAAIALLLAGVGIYGVVSYSTSQRAQEIGIRMALGATPRDIVGWILAQSLVLAAVGLALGLLGYFALSRVFSTLLYGVGANDGLSLLAAVCVLGSIALFASYIPARRAVRGDPVANLRSE
jgi:putative ABC transport system permease protein